MQVLHLKKYYLGGRKNLETSVLSEIMMDVSTDDAITKFLVLCHHSINFVCLINIKVIHVVQPSSFSTTTNNLLGENILKQAKFRIN